MIPTAKAPAQRDDALTFFSMVNRPFPGKIVSKRQKTLPLQPRHLQSFFPGRASRCAKRLLPRPYSSWRGCPRYFKRWTVYRSTSKNRYGGGTRARSELIRHAHNDGAFWPVYSSPEKPDNRVRSRFFTTATPSTTASNLFIASSVFLIPTRLFCRIESESKSQYSL
jgi:hypothetical protein